MPERNVEWLREVIHRDYRIMYDYREARGEVWILAVYHAKRDVARLLEERWERDEDPSK